VSARYNKRAEDAHRKPRDGKYLKKVFQDLVNCKKPTGDPDRPPNVTRAKEIERYIEAEVGMTTVADARRDSDSGSDEESQDDEEDSQAGGDSDSEPEAPSKPAKETRRTTVERFRTPREEIKAQNAQRDTVMCQISSALARDPAKDLGAIFETSGLMQVLQNQVQMAEARYNQLLADNKRLQEKYDEKVAEAQDLKLDLRLLQARSGGPGLEQASDPFTWSSPIMMAKRHGGYRDDRDGNAGGNLNIDLLKDEESGFNATRYMNTQVSEALPMRLCGCRKDPLFLGILECFTFEQRRRLHCSPLPKPSNWRRECRSST
jgi:hypothetical protein